MWNWNSNLSLEMNINKNLVDNFRKYAKISGTLFIILGAVGIIFPTFMSFTTLAFVAYLMLFAGISAGWLTWISNKNDWAGWLKSFVLIVVSLFMIFYPMQGIAALGLLFAIYFFTDAFAGFGLAFSLKPQKIWWMWLVNAVTSLILGFIFLIGWPFSSLFMVGLLVGISLLFDGVALLSGGMFLDTAEKEDKTEEANKTEKDDKNETEA
ncbi:hypothetical protein MNB_SV-10-1082 [hydrothermal vent metagenome]|uniref:Bll4390 protein n=1 Tax=hydrothermal vent metagenome TaxID=652676 RepID=A0A1W1CSN8_9ZZZZ